MLRQIRFGSSPTTRSILRSPRRHCRCSKTILPNPLGSSHCRNRLSIYWVSLASASPTQSPISLVLSHSKAVQCVARPKLVHYMAQHASFVRRVKLRKMLFRVFDLVKHGEIKFIVSGIQKRVASEHKAFGLRRDLHLTFQSPEALIDISIRPFEDEDQKHFSMDLQNDGLVAKHIPNCYVATTEDDIPCYRQWLMGPKQNGKIREFWGSTFPVLREDEALLESAFTSPNFRGKRIMPAAMARIAEQGNNLGVRWIITFVGIENIPSLKGCQRSGFSPYILRNERWFLFKRTVTFEEIPKELLDTYSKMIGVKP